MYDHQPSFNNHHQTPTYERCPDENRTGTLIRTSGGNKIVIEFMSKILVLYCVQSIGIHVFLNTRIGR